MTIPPIRSTWRSRAKRWSVALAALVIALLIAATAAEAYFRLKSVRLYVPDEGIAADGALGWDRVPPVTPLSGNTGRGSSVVFLGDSFTDRKEWPEEAQRRLADRGIAIDGFNLGVTGFGTTQELMKFQQHAGRLAPRVVVVLFFAWNDLRDNYPYPEIVYGPQRAARPYLLVSGQQATLTPVRWTSSAHASLMRSEVYLRLYARVALPATAAVVRRWPTLPAAVGWRAKVYFEEPISWHPFYDQSQAETLYVRGAYDATMAAFIRLRDLAATFGASLLVIGIDNPFTVDREVFDHFIRPFPQLDPSLPLARMARLLATADIPFINAQPELAALASQSSGPVYNGPAHGLGIAGHLHPEGDRIIGDIAARWIAESLPQHQP
jgi:hypothetical protein